MTTSPASEPAICGIHSAHDNAAEESSLTPEFFRSEATRRASWSQGSPRPRPAYHSGLKVSDLTRRRAEDLSQLTVPGVIAIAAGVQSAAFGSANGNGSAGGGSSLWKTSDAAYLGKVPTGQPAPDSSNGGRSRRVGRGTRLPVALGSKVANHSTTRLAAGHRIGALSGAMSHRDGIRDSRENEFLHPASSASLHARTQDQGPIATGVSSILSNIAGATFNLRETATQRTTRLAASYIPRHTSGYVSSSLSGILSTDILLQR